MRFASLNQYSLLAVFVLLTVYHPAAWGMLKEEPASIPPAAQNVEEFPPSGVMEKASPAAQQDPNANPFPIVPAQEGSKLTDASDKPPKAVEKPTLELARRLLSEKKFAPAFQASDELLKSDPKNIDLLTIHAESATKLGNIKQAIIDLQLALELQPENAELHNSLGFVYMTAGQLDQASEEFTTAIALDAKQAKAFNNRGMIKVAQQDFLMAVNDFNEALQVNENYVDAYNNRGFAYWELGNHAEAIKNFDSAIKLDPDYFNAYNNRGLALIKIGELEAAVKDFTTAIKLAPRHVKHYLHRAMAYDELGQTDLARGDRQKIVWLEELAGIEMRLSEYPDSVGVRVELANHYLRADEFAAAQKIAAVLAENESSRVQGLLIDAQIADRSGKPEEVLRITSQIITDSPEENDAYSLRGNAYLAMGDLDKAIEDYERSGRFDAQVASAYWKRSQKLARENKTEKAQADRSKALMLDPTLAESSAEKP